MSPTQQYMHQSIGEIHKRNSGKESKRGPPIKSNEHMPYVGGL